MSMFANVLTESNISRECMFCTLRLYPVTCSTMDALSILSRAQASRQDEDSHYVPIPSPKPIHALNLVQFPALLRLILYFFSRASKVDFVDSLL
jgi:hypothetical protein